MSSHPPRPHRLAMLLPLLVAACATEPSSAAPERVERQSTGQAPTAAGPARVEPFSDPLAGIRLPGLAPGILVDAEHYDTALPAHKFKHSFRLSTEAGTVVVIDVWDNPRRLALRAWFDENLAYLADAGTRVEDQLMTRNRVAGLLLHKPRSPQAHARSIAVFATGERVFRVSCTEADGDNSARSLFDQVISQLEVGVAP